MYSADPKGVLAIFTLNPHKLILDVDGIPRVEHEADFVLLVNGPDKVYVQQGQIYAGDLSRPCSQDEVPEWFWGSYGRLTSQARTSCGLRLPEDELRDASQLPAEFLATFNSLPEHLKRQLIPAAVGRQEAPRIDEKAPKTFDEYNGEGVILRPSVASPGAPQLKSWVCDQCGEVVGTRIKGVHIAGHRRAALAAERAQRVGA